MAVQLPGWIVHQPSLLQLVPSKRPMAARTARPVLLQTLKAASAGPAPKNIGPKARARSRGVRRIVDPVWRESAWPSTVRGLFAAKMPRVPVKSYYNGKHDGKLL